MEHTRWYLWQLAARLRSKPRHATDLRSAAVWTKIPSIWGLWVVNSQIMKCFYCFIIFIIHQLRWWSLDLFAIDQTIWSNLVIQRSPGLFILLVCWPCQVWTDPVQCTSDQETTQEWGFCTLGLKRLTKGQIRKWFHGWLRSVTYHVMSHPIFLMPCMISATCDTSVLRKSEPSKPPALSVSHMLQRSLSNLTWDILCIFNVIQLTTPWRSFSIFCYKLM